MDKLRGSGRTLYALISGGIHGHGPRTFLYAIDPTDLTKWTYLHPLIVDLPVNHVPSSKWAGDFGANWECTNFVTLHGDSGRVRELVFAGAEGGKERPWVEDYHTSHGAAARRVPRYSNWLFGRLGLKESENEVRMSVDIAGLLDWGVFYAANSFKAADGRTVLWGWLIEEDLTDSELAKKGWTGCLGVPREIILNTEHGVVGALVTELEAIKSVEVIDDAIRPSSGSTVLTLGIRPIQEMKSLRKAVLYECLPGPLKAHRTVLPAASLTCEIQAIVHVFESTESVSLVLRHNDDQSIRTSIVFRPRDETLTVEREYSTSRDDVNTCPEVGSHTLFRLRSKDATENSIEPLRLTVLLDHDVIEVFANDRFALSTRVYTAPEHTGLSLMSKGGGWVEDFRVWEMAGIGLQD